MISYTKTLADTILAVTAAGIDASVQRELLQEISVLLRQMQDALAKLKDVEARARVMEEGKAQAFFYKDEVTVAMEALRIPADKLEVLVDKKMWPFPTYADLIFEV